LLDQSQPVQWENRTHFFGIAARLMRMILVDHARTHHAAKRGGAEVAVTLEDYMAVSPCRAPDVLEVDEALERLAEIDERKAKVIEMRYFGGMDREEVAAALGLTVATVKRDLRLGEAWLRRFLAGEGQFP
jgi:RNA polymerase sigma factor (TIGR02999 family)